MYIYVYVVAWRGLKQQFNMTAKNVMTTWMFNVSLSPDSREANTAVASPHWLAIEIRWYDNLVSRGSPEFDATLQPSKVTNSAPLSQKGPNVSRATGTKNKDRDKSEYIPDLTLRCELSSILCSMNSAVQVWLLLKGFATVASEARQRPSDQGILVTPSGRRSSDLVNPLGSRFDGTPALARARFMTSVECAVTGQPARCQPTGQLRGFLVH